MDTRRRDGPTCLVLAPYGGSWSSVHQALEDRLQLDGVSLRWVNAGVDLDKPIALAVHQYLLQADVIVADITDGNPNVMYELGFAQALGKPILPVVERQVQSVPPVVRGRLFLVYDRENPEDAVTFLTDWVVRHLTRTLQSEELVG